MTPHECDLAGHQLTDLQELLTAIKFVKGDEFSEIRQGFQELLDRLTGAPDAVPYPDVLRFCARAQEAIDAKFRQYPEFRRELKKWLAETEGPIV
jgi:hypothetical protein